MDTLHLLHILSKRVHDIGHGVLLCKQDGIESRTLVCFLDRRGVFHHGFGYKNSGTIRVVCWEEEMKKLRSVAEGSFLIAFTGIRTWKQSRKLTREFRVCKKLSFRACWRSRKNTTTVKWGKPLFMSAGQSSMNEEHLSTSFWKSTRILSTLWNVLKRLTFSALYFRHSSRPQPSWRVSISSCVSSRNNLLGFIPKNIL